jgi:hypothetical protein
MLPFAAEHRVVRPRQAAASQPAAARPPATRPAARPATRPAARGPATRRASAAAAAAAAAAPSTVDASAAAARRATITQLRRVLAAGYASFDPLGPSAAPLQVQHGLSAGWQRMVKDLPSVGSADTRPCSA